MLGRIGDQPCVIWDQSTPGASHEVFIEYGKIWPPDPATRTVRIDAPVSPLTLPADALPPFRGSDACFTGDEAQFMVSVLVSGKTLGGELWRSCEHSPVLPDGCVGPGFGYDVNIGRTDQTVCLTWEDRTDDETGFRVVLEYGGGEKFEYMAPADTVELIPPAADVAGLGSFGSEFARKNYGIKVWAIRPGGEEPVGAMFVQVM
jgi:hypothetical protein